MRTGRGRSSGSARPGAKTLANAQLECVSRRGLGGQEYRRVGYVFCLNQRIGIFGWKSFASHLRYRRIWQNDVRPDPLHQVFSNERLGNCLLYTSDAADE